MLQYNVFIINAPQALNSRSCTVESRTAITMANVQFNIIFRFKLSSVTLTLDINVY